jgi:hypothetical protein
VTVPLVPEAIVAAETPIVEFARDTAPGTTVTVGSVDVTADPPTVAPMLRAVPASTPVKVAVYVPLPLSVVAEKFPVLVPPLPVKMTEEPPAVC